MSRPKISLMEAYMIETLRANGITDEEIIEKVKEENVSSLKQIHDKFDLEQLITLAEKDFTAFEQALKDGYTVKFVTVRGLENLLKLKFQKEAGKDYKKTETGIQSLQADEAVLREVKEILSPNWKIIKDKHGISVRLKEQTDF
ncbi:hypothetical protein [Oceanobacillus sp. J11TS1]|uniref:hypothetical protein n=1 Tax=Oceanobacillus sp. J11TS1 TaxID=2807191 RepID=UPI001B2B03E6|nr:hypothetical protein [Oceanobacillus sp. J11TS1]GIO21505.1 hypothetical protein J11TS1_00860 [Oceanobacillus sp. J11TS1]